MIEWIERLPDSVIGFLASGTLWFGLHYAVLAERAMEKDGATVALPRCVEALAVPDDVRAYAPSGIGRLLGVPDLDRIEALVAERARPRPLTLRERQGRCACAARQAGRRLRFDYAVHTASFRLVEPQAVEALGDSVIDTALGGTCGAVQSLRRRD